MNMPTDALNTPEDEAAAMWQRLTEAERQQARRSERARQRPGVHQLADEALSLLRQLERRAALAANPDETRKALYPVDVIIERNRIPRYDRLITLAEARMERRQAAAADDSPQSAELAAWRRLWKRAARHHEHAEYDVDPLYTANGGIDRP